MADIDRLKGDFSVYFSGEYVVLAGSKLCIFRPDGSLVACRKDLRYAGRITFLSENRMLLCSKAVFYMVDLATGSDLWSAPYTKTDFNLNDFAVSPDGAYAYTYDSRNSKNVITRLELLTPEHEVEVCELNPDPGATRDILCDEEGVPCLLKTLIETVGSRNYSVEGVRLHDFYYFPEHTSTWKTKWFFPLEEGSSALRFLGSTDRILTSGLQIRIPSTGALLPLLEVGAEALLPQDQGSPRCRRDSTGRYLYLTYLTCTAILDLQEKKVAARYDSISQGCLVENEYWVCAEGKVRRRPFPVFEEIPPVKKVGIMDWYFASRPELW